MSILDDSINWLSNQFDKIDSSVESWSTEWQTKVDNLKAKAKQFAKVYNDLMTKENIAASDPKIKKEYDNLMEKGNWLKNSIEYITNKIDWAFNSFFTSPSNNQNMGIAPLAAVVPVVAITGSITAITAWLSDAYILDRKLKHLESQTAKGIDPKTAQKGVDVSSGKGSLVNIEGTPVMGAAFLLGVGVVAWFLWPQIKKKLL